MKKGFLLSGSADETTTTESVVLTAVEASDCPVCLDELDADTSLLLPCRHSLCMECTRNLWALRRETQPSTHHLECPLCRQLVQVQKADLPAFIAAHKASNFGNDCGNTPRQRELLNAGGSPGSLAGNLTVHELRIVVRLLALQSSLVGAVDRHDLERAVESRINAQSPDSAISALPTEILCSLLDGRGIPRPSIPNNAELAKLVERSPRGACQNLPVGVLRAMLRRFGHGSEAYSDLEKGDLARRVMAARLMASKPAARGDAASSAAPYSAVRRNDAETDVDLVRTPTCGSCCTVS